MPKKFITQKERKIPVVASADVIVIGGGPAGTSAAVSAAREGTQTILIERYGFLGGLATGGLVIMLCGGTSKGNPIVGGLYQEILKELQKRKLANDEELPTISPEGFKLILDEYMAKEGINLFLHSFAVDAILSEKKDAVRYIIIESKEGRFALQGKAFIDASGDADMAKWCQIPFEISPNLRPITTVYRMGNIDMKKAMNFKDSPQYTKKMSEWSEIEFRPAWEPTLNYGEAWMDDIFMFYFNPLKIKDLTEAEILGRRKVFEMFEHYKMNFPGFENASLIDTAPILGVRETRRIKGQYILTQADVLNQTKFDDSIALGVGPNGVFAIPYRSLIPKKINNLLFAGRCISVEPNALDYVRVISTCIAIGEAAGIAASLIVKNNCSSTEVNIKKLQSLLQKKGSFF